MKSLSDHTPRFLESQRAIVTGGSRGIGLSIAQALLSEGARVLITGRDAASLAKAAEHLKSSVENAQLDTYIADVGNSQQVESLFAQADAKLGGLDILINNAGSGVFRPVADLSIAEWDHTIATNLSGVFYCSHFAIPRLRQSNHAFIINISSLAGRNPFAGGSAYNASKFGLNGLSEVSMLDHRHDRIRVSCVMPGSVDTAFDGKQSNTKSDWKIAPEDVAEIVVSILRMPERTLISRVEVRPSRPASH